MHRRERSAPPSAYFSVAKRTKPSRYRNTRSGSTDVSATYTRRSYLYPSSRCGSRMYLCTSVFLLVSLASLLFRPLASLASSRRVRRSKSPSRSMRTPRPRELAGGLMMYVSRGPRRARSLRHSSVSRGSRNDRGAKSKASGCRRRAFSRFAPSLSFLPSSHVPGKWFTRWCTFRRSKSPLRNAPFHATLNTPGGARATPAPGSAEAVSFSVDGAFRFAFASARTRNPAVLNAALTALFLIPPKRTHIFSDSGQGEKPRVSAIAAGKKSGTPNTATRSPPGASGGASAGVLVGCARSHSRVAFGTQHERWHGPSRRSPGTSRRRTPGRYGCGDVDGANAAKDRVVGCFSSREAFANAPEPEASSAHSTSSSSSSLSSSSRSSSVCVGAANGRRAWGWGRVSRGVPREATEGNRAR